MRNSAQILAIDCIYDALIALMKVKPYNKISVTDITERAGVSRMAYYRNYEEKDDILLNRFREELIRLEENLLNDQISSKPKVFGMLINLIDNDSPGHYILQANLFNKAFLLFRNFLIGFYPKVGIDIENDKTRFYKDIGGLLGCMLYTLEHRESEDKQQIAAHLAEIMDYLDIE